LKRIAALVSIVIFSASSVSAAQPALDILNESAAGLSFQADIPAAQPPLTYRIFELPESDMAGEELFTYLHEATDPATREPYSYSAARKFMYSKGDNTGCNGKPGIITFYSQVCVNGSSDNGNDYPERGDINGDGVVDSFINAEHIWPQGYFDSKLPMVADLHHLAPTFVTPNGRRGNLKFAKVASFVYRTSAGSKLGKEGFEPADAVKGNVARAVMYFIVRYHDKNIRQGMDYNSFWVKNVPMLMEWNRQDPPDAAERRRNDLVEDFQGNRNPFIDNPELAERIGELVFKSH
jgi:hypothetical protein